MKATYPVTSQKVEDFKEYLVRNRSRCRDCNLWIFWCKTPNGKRIPMDFPDLIRNPNLTHELVPTYGEGGQFMDEVEAWSHTNKPTHTCHFDTCEKRSA